MQPIYWVLLFVLLLIIEAATLGLTTIWFAAGSLVAFLAGLMGAGLAVQIGLFLVVSVVLLILTLSLSKSSRSSLHIWYAATRPAGRKTSRHFCTRHPSTDLTKK